MSLEWLRFWLGLYIVLFHTLHYYSDSIPWGHYLSSIGFFSTSTFFLLSGFLLAHVYLDVNEQGVLALRESKRSFLTKRFANLYPIHIGAIIITIAVLVVLPMLGISQEDQQSTSIRFIIYDVHDGTPMDKLVHWMSDPQLILAAIMNLTLTHAWNPYYLTFNAPSWSISALFFFYMLFPWLAPRLRAVKRPIIALLLINLLYLVPTLLVIFFTHYGMPETGILHRNPIIRLPEFMAGIVLCGLYHQRLDSGKRLSRGTVIGLMVFVVVAIVFATITVDKGPYFLYYLYHNGGLLLAESALLYLCVVLPMNPSSRSRKIAAYLGGASLPMFALHVPLYLIFSRIEMVLSGKPSLCMQGEWGACFEAARGISPSPYWYPLYLLITVAFCVVFQQEFVVRIRRWLIAHMLHKAR